ncbi:MAG: flagellar protein [Lachnospiraceae bacterium]|nr:flagellar protein [Lachnospiraceae bacterium]MBQ8262091.1 flagellar protein [Lachnospiraceae bacterium]
MELMQQRILSLEQARDTYFPKTGKPQPDSAAAPFGEILKYKTGLAENGTEELKFSKHASGRLQERNIELSTEQLERLQEGRAKAEAKGINESLVIVDRLAFIVNVPNNTVITAMEQSETEENIFTNIDGAVII